MSVARLIPVHKGGVAVAHAQVDPDDFDLVSQHRWYLLPKGYAVAVVNGAKNLYMHRLILGLTTGDPRHTDHIDHDRLNNQRSNLRACTPRENHQNRVSKPGSASQYRGVYRARGDKWRACVTIDSVQRRVGTFENELDAARAAARYRAEHMPFSVEDPELLGEAA